MLSGLECTSLDVSRASGEWDWEFARVGELFYVKGRIGWRGLRRSDFTVDGPFLITGIHIEDGRVQWEQCFHIPESRLNESPEIIVQHGDMVVTKDGTIGKVAYIDFLPGPTSLNSHLFLVRPKVTGIDRRFAYHVFTSFLFQRFIEQQSSGSTLTGLPEGRFLNFVLPLPPLCEQLRIAAVLNTVDEAIAKTEAVIAKLKQVRAGLLHDLLTRGLDEYGQLRDPLAHPEQFQDSPLGRIPREWAVLTIEALLARVPNPLRSGPFGSALLKQELKESGIPLLGIDNVHIEKFVADYTRFVDDDKFIELRRYAVRAGDVMITIMGTVGRCCVVPDSIGIALSSKHVWTITLDQSRYSPHVACWQMNFAPWVLRQFKRDEQGGVMTAIRSETLRQLLLPVPSPPEMQAIEEMLLQFNRRIGEEETLLSMLTALKSGLMSDLLTGRVRVPEGIAVAS
jgi:type I restriction enzyme S subunit